MGGKEKERFNSVKYLEVIIDENFEYACKKIAKKVNFLERISQKLYT